MSDPPRVLVIDDLLGRAQPGGRNEERVDLCGQMLLQDVTGDTSEALRIAHPTAGAIFCRGQRPIRAAVGDRVENDVDLIVAAVRQGWDQRPAGRPPWALVLLDLCFYTGMVTPESEANRGLGMPGGRENEDEPSGYFGIHVLETLTAAFPDLPIAILSGQDRKEVSRTFTAKGAIGFLDKSDREGLVALLDRHGLVPDPDGRIAGYSVPLLLALRAARRASSVLDMGAARNVLVRGERGTGKELFARFMHSRSPRAEAHALVAVDSGGLSPTLWASELFGHERGAFTDAREKRVGRMVQANGGHLFLDEIGNMPLEVQSGLLRVLETGVVVPLGAAAGQEVDLRVLSATNEDIELKANTGGFRADLLDRLRDAGAIFLPPLRDRLDDVGILVERFVRDAEAMNQAARARTVEPEVIELIKSLEWPDNIRGLRNCVLQAVNDNPDLEHLVPSHLVRSRAGSAPRSQARRPQSESDAPLPRVEEEPGRPAEIAALLGAARVDETATELQGAIVSLNKAYARYVARCLRAALAVTRKPTNANPEGEVSIYRAVKLAMGTDDLTAAQAADLVKRLLGVSPGDIGDLLADPILREAYDTARRLRPTNRKAVPGRSQTTRSRK